MRRRTRPPNVVLVVVDTLRADRLGSYGNPRPLSPFIDALAARGTVFTHAYATSSWTCPSIASLFTSRYPSQHQVTHFGSRLVDDEVTVAERLGRRYLSGGFSANFRLSNELGYGQGFTAWFSFIGKDKIGTDRAGRRSLRWLDRARNRWWRRLGRPVLLYYHLMEPHAPYLPRRDQRERWERPEEAGLDAAAPNEKLVRLRWDELSSEDVRFLGSLYDAEVATLDLRLRWLFAELERRGVLDRAIVVLTADHGEEFGEHGMFTHGTSLFDELLHVPLIVIVPGVPGGRRVDENVSLVDVAPTLLDLLGLLPEPRFAGRSLVPALRGRDTASGDVIAELLPSGGVDRHRFALLRGRVKLLLPRARDGGRPGPLLFDLARDPGEVHPNPPALLAKRASYVKAAHRLRAALAAQAPRAETVPIDERTRQRLRALGYVR